MLRASVVSVVFVIAIVAALPPLQLFHDKGVVGSVDAAEEALPGGERALLQLVSGGGEEVSARACYSVSCNNACRALGWSVGLCIGSECWCFR